METKTLSIIAVILAFLFAPAGLILGIVALVEINKIEGEGKGLAIAAIVISSLALVFSALLFIGFIAYFGVLNPASVMPERCELQQGFFCNDWIVSQNSVQLTFQNGRGSGMVLQSVSVTETGGQSTCQWSGTVEIANGASQSITVTGCNLPKGNEKAHLDLALQWYNAGSSPLLSHTMNGQLVAKVK